MKTMLRSTRIVMEKMKKHLDVLFTLKFKPKASFVQKAISVFVSPRFLEKDSKDLSWLNIL